MLRAGGFPPPVTLHWMRLGDAQNSLQSISHDKCVTIGLPFGPIQARPRPRPRPFRPNPNSHKLEIRKPTSPQGAHEVCRRFTDAVYSALDSCNKLLEVPAAVGQGMVLAGEDDGGYVTKGIECLRSCQASAQVSLRLCGLGPEAEQAGSITARNIFKRVMFSSVEGVPVQGCRLRHSTNFACRPLGSHSSNPWAPELDPQP